MPHFILDCSPGLFAVHEKATVMRAVFDIAEESGLFDKRDIKVRIREYSDFITHGNSDVFVHVFGYIMEGRTASQKHNLTKAMVRMLKDLFPDVPIISMNVMDFEKATYNNRNTV